MITGFYRHYKGGLYFVFCKAFEATNSQVCEEKVVYFSFKARRFFVRRLTEFFEGPIFTIQGPLREYITKGWEPVYRFQRIFPPWSPFKSMR